MSLFVRAGWLILAALLAGCAQAPSAPGGGVSVAVPAGPGCGLALASTVPMTLAGRGTRLLVPASVDGQPLTLIFDTGAEDTMMSNTALRKSSRNVTLGSMIPGQVTKDTGFVRGFGGSRVVSVVHVDRFELGRVHGGLEVRGADLGFRVDGKAVAGLLGMNAVGSFDIDIDVAAGQLRLFRASGRCGAPTTAIAQPLYVVPELAGFDREISPRINVTIHGQVFRALIDSGAFMSSISASAAARLGLVGAAVAGDRTLATAGVGGASPALLHQLDAIGIGPLTLRHVPLALVAEDPGRVDVTLGIDFLQRVHLWISNSSHAIIMQFPPVTPVTLAGRG